MSVYVGIDVHRKRSRVAVINQDGEVLANRYVRTVLVMAALAICAVTAALLRRRTGTRPPTPAHPDQPPPADPGMIPLTVPETGRLLARPHPAVPRTGWTGGAATRPAHAGTTSAHGEVAASRTARFPAPAPRPTCLLAVTWCQLSGYQVRTRGTFGPRPGREHARKDACTVPG